MNKLKDKDLQDILEDLSKLDEGELAYIRRLKPFKLPIGYAIPIADPRYHTKEGILEQVNDFVMRIGFIYYWKTDAKGISIIKKPVELEEFDYART